MKQLLLILSIALLTIGCEPERYSKDEVTENNDIVLHPDGTPVTGIVYSEYENGQLQVEGNFKDGIEDGLWRQWHENGQLWHEINYKDGERDGFERWLFENGQLSSEGNYKDGQRDGLHRWWYKNGQLAYEINYKDGKLISKKWWDEDGNPK